MHILNIGSIHIDHLYRVDHFVRPGETVSSVHYGTFAGGKGFNQFNPAPMSPAVRDYPLRDVDLFILNETEAEGLTGQNTPENVHAAMRALFPSAAAVLTMERKGAAYLDADGIVRHPAIAVQAVDTTAAGDTFIGYFLAEMMRTGAPDKALPLGCYAAAVCVTRQGASDSIPVLSEVVEQIGALAGLARGY